MAQKRMFTLQIVDSDAFLDMSSSAQALYFHLAMRADDDGFVNSPKKIAKIVNASDDDMKILLFKKFIIGFESGVIVIKHWRMHNYIQKDRYHTTTYHEEMALLSIDENNGYTLDTKCVQDVTSDKIRLELDKTRDSIEIVSPKGSRFKKPTIEEIKTEIQAKNYNVDAETFYHFYESNGWHVGNKKMKSWQSALVTWHRKSKTYLSPKQAQYDRSTNESSRSYIVADENTF